ncbi:uncharacterized protein KGF55_004897 [Candida pseudojiufengensis]|uniref:uncharacterized protein n=1 Tax=Candida pseudojiufengensis TaxID=497109 RepID=UPI002224FB04|nr:uncharacterized protein KGF55_004897 [Candida pseudojiufengensis]KAI5960174.1 hypothetical protein KGF55_004897 [Candida pseudojiufengensis]
MIEKISRPKGRPRVLPIAQRKKVSRACDVCKRRKMKCDGTNPCQYCQSKVLTCKYSKIDGRSLKSKAYLEKLRQNQGQELPTSPSQDTNEFKIPSLTTSPTTVPQKVGVAVQHQQEHQHQQEQQHQLNQDSQTQLPAHSQHSHQGNGQSTQRKEQSRPRQHQPINLERSSSISLSIICENLQAALTNDNIISKNDQEGLSNLNGQHTRLLTTKTGNLRFFGESSALSLLGECRSLFREISGPSLFTNDPVQQFITDESVDFRNLPVPSQLPTKQDALILIDLFKTNINDTFYIFNMQYFNQYIFEETYKNPINTNTKKLCLLYNVFAIGRLYSECSPNLQLNLPSSEIFFNSAQVFFRSNVFDGKLWISEVNFLEYFYYQSCCNRSNAWIQLGNAIRIAQALGLHRHCINSRIENIDIKNHRRRLWRSLYVCDCISGVNLGRPLMINDYDYDDSNCKLITENLNEVEKIRIMAQKATSDSALINVKIVENIFKDGIVNIKRAHILALQLKRWSVELPKELQLSAALETQMESGTDPNNYLYVLVHIGQLYGIMTLTRPFLVYVVTRKLKPETKQQIKDEQSLMNFCKACIKASFLVIKLLKFFVTHNPNRKEVFTIQSSCFFASIILGFTLLEQRNSSKPDYHYISVLQDALDDGYNILNNFAYFNITCKRWATNLQNMMNDLKKYDKTTTTTNSESSLNSLNSENNNEIFNNEMISLGTENKALEEMINFQQFFVPSTIHQELDQILNSANKDSSSDSGSNIYKNNNKNNYMDFLDAFRYDNQNHVFFGERE